MTTLSYDKEFNIILNHNGNVQIIEHLDNEEQAKGYIKGHLRAMLFTPIPTAPKNICNCGFCMEKS